MSSISLNDFHILAKFSQHSHKHYYYPLNWGGGKENEAQECI